MGPRKGMRGRKKDSLGKIIARFLAISAGGGDGRRWPGQKKSGEGDGERGRWEKWMTTQSDFICGKTDLRESPVGGSDDDACKGSPVVEGPFSDIESTWCERRYAPRRKPQTGPNAHMEYMMPMYMEESSRFTWLSTYVVPSVNSGEPPQPKRSLYWRRKDCFI